MQRRTFLATTITGVGGLLADRLPGNGLRVDGEPLTQLSDAITGLHFLDARDGAASVLMPTCWLAGRLTHTLVNTPPQHDEYLNLAALAADAAEHAGWVSFENGEYGAALHWYGQAIKATEKARDRDLAAFVSEGYARASWLGLSDGEAGLRALDDIKLDPLSPRLRALVHEGRARALAAVGKDAAGKDKEKASLRAIEEAGEAATYDGPAWMARSVRGTPAHIEVGHGLVLADLGRGHGKEAYKLLKGSLRRLPKRLRRLEGTLHRGLAQAAILMDEPVQAAEHVFKAHEIFTATKSRQLLVVKAISRALETRYGDVAEVRDLTERLRVETRYVTTRTSTRGQRVHQRSCPSLNRGQNSNAQAWPDGNGLEPADVAALVEARPAEGRPRLGVCRHCIVAR